MVCVLIFPFNFGFSIFPGASGYVVTTIGVLCLLEPWSFVASTYLLLIIINKYTYMSIHQVQYTYLQIKEVQQNNYFLISLSINQPIRHQ